MRMSGKGQRRRHDDRLERLLKEKERCDLKKLGVAVDVALKVRVPKNAQVISCNATSSRLPLFSGLGRIPGRSVASAKGRSQSSSSNSEATFGLIEHQGQNCWRRPKTEPLGVRISIGADSQNNFCSYHGPPKRRSRLFTERVSFSRKCEVEMAFARRALCAACRRFNARVHVRVRRPMSRERR